jgi:hypothetical protein
MSDIEINESFADTVDSTIDDSRKKLKQTHLQVFNTQATPTSTPIRANHPQLMQQQALDHENGSDNNLSISEEDIASMYD